MSADNGGPAFPQIIHANGHPQTISEGETGMKLRDYFIAHAPAEPQPWFSPVMPPWPPSVITNEDGTRTYPHAYAAEQECGDNYVNQSRDAQAEWDKARVRELWLQWPPAWADAMLAERTK